RASWWPSARPAASSSSRRRRSSRTYAHRASRRAQPTCSRRRSSWRGRSVRASCPSPSSAGLRSSTPPGLPPGPAPGAGPIVTPSEAEPAELVITAAIVGAELTRAHTPYLPISAREIADEAACCREAGAAVIHLHVRNEDGTNTQASERFAEVIDAIRGACDCIVQPSTGGAVGMSIDERAGPLSCRPEMATLNCGSINFGDDVFINSRGDIRTLAARIQAAGAVPELECYEVGHVAEALALAAEGALRGPLHFQFVLGVKGASPARDDVMGWMRSML